MLPKPLQPTNIEKIFHILYHISMLTEFRHPKLTTSITFTMSHSTTGSVLYRTVPQVLCYIAQYHRFCAISHSTTGPVLYRTVPQVLCYIAQSSQVLCYIAQYHRFCAISHSTTGPVLYRTVPQVLCYIAQYHRFCAIFVNEVKEKKNFVSR